jgi:hypothetical protein
MLQHGGVAELVKQVAHLGDVSSNYRACPATSPEGQAATAGALVGMLVAMGCNHALLVKLADRLHDMRTLGALPAAKRNRLAQETIDVWAPLANRLGVWSLKAQLEDLAFKQLYPGQVRGGATGWLGAVLGWEGGGWQAGIACHEARMCVPSSALAIWPADPAVAHAPAPLPAVCRAAQPAGAGAEPGAVGWTDGPHALRDAAPGHQVGYCAPGSQLATE